MKSNLTLLNINTVESKLLHMKDLKERITELEAEYNLLKKQVIQDYFANSDEYMTSKGLVLATYKQYEENRFNAKRFEMDHPDVYAGYKEKNIIHKFLLK